MSHWYCQPILNSYLLVAGVAVGLLLLLLVGPTFHTISRRRRFALLGLRAAVVLLLVLAMLRPTHISTTSQPQSAVLLVLFDQSRSMNLPGAEKSASRWAEQIETLRASQATLADLPERLAVRVYAYDGELHPIELTGGELQLPAEPAGGQTDLGSTLHEAVRREAGKRLAGVVLMGDGTQTAFHPAVEIQEAGRELDRLGAPLFAVPYGPPGAIATARDVAVENLPDQFTVFVKSQLDVQALLRVSGFVNQPIPVELLVQRPDGGSETIGPQPLVAREDGQLVPIALSYTPQVAGRYKLTLRAAAQDGEIVTRNNELSAFLRVLEGGLRVLYLEGELRAEQKFLRRSLDASPDIDVDFRWLDHRGRERWPVDLKKEMQDPAYDAVILGDLDSAALGPANLELLKAAVERGRGMAMLGGWHSFGAGGYGDSPLADVLPIEIDRLERQDFDASLRGDLHLPGPLQLLPAADHPLTRLAASGELAGLWKKLPPLSGANKFTKVKDAAGVRVVGEDAAGRPLLVVGNYGSGRVLAMAGDSTWRWWMQGHETEHKRFWRQVVLWLAQRDQDEQDEVWIKLDQRRFQPGGRVTFTAGARSATGESLADAELTATLIPPNGQRKSISLIRDRDHFRGVIDAVTEPGDYAIELEARRGNPSLGQARGEFLVFDQDLELSNAATDHAQLARLAEMTQSVGGRLVAAEQLPALLAEIRDRPPELAIEVQEKWQLGDTGPDAWLLFAAFLALLTGEWYFRKRWGLV